MPSEVEPLEGGICSTTIHERPDDEAELRSRSIDSNIQHPDAARQQNESVRHSRRARERRVNERSTMMGTR